MKRLLISLAALAAIACQPEATATARSVRVRVFDDQGRALVGIPIELDGMSTIKTSGDGTSQISLSPTGPARARIGVRCAADQRELAPRHVTRALAGGTAQLELSFICRPRLRTLALVVRAPGGSGLLVRADGEPLGRIEPDSTLHASVSRAPGSELRLTIDTGDLPLTPSHPLRVVHVLDRDELIIFDQPLTRRRETRRSTAIRTNIRSQAGSAANEACFRCEERSPECTAIDLPP